MPLSQEHGRDQQVLLTTSSNALEINKSPMNSSSQEHVLSMCCFHVILPIRASRALGGSSGPLCQLQPSLPECSGGSTPRPSTHVMLPARILECSCSLPATILQSASWSGFHSCRCPEAQEILPVGVPPSSLDQKQQMGSQKISSPDVVHARFAKNIA